MRDDRYSKRTWDLIYLMKKWQFYAAVFAIVAAVLGLVVRPTIHDVWAIFVFGALFIGMFSCLGRVAVLGVAMARSAKQDKADREAA